LPGADTLVKAQAAAVKVAEFETLPADTLIWLAMVFDLIAARYWGQPDKLLAKPLSYTGAMIEQPLSLTDGCQALAIRDYKPLQFKPFKTEDVLSDNVEFEVPKTGQNRWMEERYKDQVPIEFLNPTPSTRVQLPESMLPQIDPNNQGLFHVRDVTSQRANLQLSQLREDYWGTPAELRKTHQWVARKNFATTIEQLAKQEYEQELPRVQEWYKQRVEANKDFILRALATGELILPSARGRSESGFSIVKREARRTERKAIGYCMRGESKPGYYIADAMSGRALFLENGYERRHDAFHCYLRPENIADEMAYIYPDCPEAVAILAGCHVEEMPVFIQNWFEEELYSGNSILSDVDPLEDINNPWHDGFKPRVYIRFCRSAFYRLQRQLGLPKAAPWETTKDLAV
jgi:hypothetical protein